MANEMYGPKSSKEDLLDLAGLLLHKLGGAVQISDADILMYGSPDVAIEVIDEVDMPGLKTILLKNLKEINDRTNGSSEGSDQEPK